MIKNKEINKVEIPSFACGAEYEGKLYIASEKNNMLYEYDCAKNELRCIAFFEKEKDTEYLYRTCILYKEKAWFIPQTAENIAIVDLKTFLIEYIPLSYKWIEKSYVLKCASAGVYQDHYLYITPYDIDCVTLIDMDNKSVRVFNDVRKRGEMYSDAYYYNGCLYCLPWTAENILKIDVITGEMHRLEWKYGKKQYGQAIVDHEKEEVWFTPAGASKILKLNLKKNEWSTFPFEAGNERGADNYIESFYGKILNGKVFMLPYSGKKIISIEKEKKSIYRYAYHCEKAKIPFLKPIYSTNLIAVIECTNQLLYYNEQRECFEQRDLKLTIDKEIMEIKFKKMQMQIGRNQLVWENDMTGINQYIQYIME